MGAPAGERCAGQAAACGRGARVSARVSPAGFTTVQVADPLYGEWLDVFVKVLQPLPPPVTGILGAHIMRRAGADPGVVAAQRAVECVQGEWNTLLEDAGASPLATRPSHAL